MLTTKIVSQFLQMVQQSFCILDLDIIHHNQDISKFLISYRNCLILDGRGLKDTTFEGTELDPCKKVAD